MIKGEIRYFQKAWVMLDISPNLKEDFYILPIILKKFYYQIKVPKINLE